MVGILMAFYSNFALIELDFRVFISVVEELKDGSS